MNTPQLFEFVSHHPLLILAFLGVAGLLLLTELRTRLSGMKQIGITQATQLSNRSNALFLDIRDTPDYDTGHIPDSVHIPLKQLSERSTELEKYRDRPVIAYCRSGSRSTSAGSTLKKLGFENVYNLSGGISAWQSANLPVSK
jgi:rhodanese-related sulfurtransferase